MNFDWNIFHNLAFSDIDIADCNDTVEGICYTDKTFDECLSFAKKSRDCDAGYFISGWGKSICVPLYTRDKNFYPSYRLIDKNNYPELDGYSITTFTDKSIYQFPPNIPNVVFFTDLFYLQNVQSKKYVGLNHFSKLDIDHIDLNDKGMNLELIPIEKGLIGKKPVKNGEKVAIHIPGSNLLMHKNKSADQIGWEARLNDNENAFQIHSVNTNSTYLPYDTNVYITYKKIYIVEKVGKELQITHSSYEEAISDGKNVVFTMKPHFNVYYDDNGSCRKIELSKTKRDGVTASYNEKPVMRHSRCWKIRSEKQISPIFFSLFFVLFVFVSYLLFCRFSLS